MLTNLQMNRERPREVWFHVGRTAQAHIFNQICQQGYAQAALHIYYFVQDKVRNKIGDQVRDEVKDPVGRQTREETGYVN